jgi:ElaB/YqjD/DUF883 family membrane-anchored ribosome-binding protein
MSNTATMSNAARELNKDAKDTVKDAGKIASDGFKDVQEDFDALRQDVARLTEQLADLLAAKGNAAWRKAKRSASGVVSDVESKGQEAVDAAREMGDNIADVVNDSIQTRPYTTLALALGIGFLFGATWRR